MRFLTVFFLSKFDKKNFLFHSCVLNFKVYIDMFTKVDSDDSGLQCHF